MYLDVGKKYVLIDGALVETDALRIAEKVRDYDHNLQLICLMPDEGTLASEPYMVICRKPDGSYYKVLGAWELDDRILERLQRSDQRKFDQIKTLESMEAKQAKLKEDRYREIIDPILEMGKAALKSEKSSFSYRRDNGDLVQLNDDGPVTVNKNKKSFS